MSKIWIDGICKSCSSIVIETSAVGDFISDEQLKEHPYADYQNTCTNPSCENYGWHFQGDDEELDYYTHEEGYIYELGDKVLQKIAKTVSSKVD